LQVVGAILARRPAEVLFVASSKTKSQELKASFRSNTIDNTPKTFFSRVALAGQELPTVDESSCVSGSRVLSAVVNEFLDLTCVDPVVPARSGPGGDQSSFDPLEDSVRLDVQPARHFPRTHRGTSAFRHPPPYPAACHPVFIDMLDKESIIP
jgi:hypothetical protein